MLVSGRDQVAGAVQEWQPVGLVQTVIHRGPQQARVRGDDGRRQQGRACDGGRGLVMRNARRQCRPHLRGAAGGRGDEDDRDPGLGDPEATENRGVTDPASDGQGDAAVEGGRHVVGVALQRGRQGQDLICARGLAAGAGAQQQAGHDGGGAAPQPARDGNHAAHLDPPGAGSQLRAMRRAQALPKGADQEVLLRVVVWSRRAFAMRIQEDAASSPTCSSARSRRLSAAAKQSKPLPRLALLAGTSTDAMGVDMRAEYTDA